MITITKKITMITIMKRKIHRVKVWIAAKIIRKFSISLCKYRIKVVKNKISRIIREAVVKIIIHDIF
jgi:hypothetical protein